MELVLTIAGIGALILLLTYGNIVRVARGLRLRRGTCLLKGPADLPAYFGKLRGQAEAELERLGFSFSHVQIDESPFVGPFARKWVLVYANPVAGAAAEVTLADVPEPARPFAVTFVTYFSGRHRLMTVNGIRHGLVGTLPFTTLQDPYAVDLEAQWEVHRGAAAGLTGHGRPLMLAPADYVRVANELQGAYIHTLRKEGWVDPAGEGAFRLRPGPSLRVAARLLRGAGKHKALLDRSRKQMREGAGRVDIPVEVEIESFQRAAHLQKGHGMGWAGKLALLVATMVFFALSFGVRGSWETALVITAVILLHEGGHYLGMRLFRYQDVKVLFLPFLGAVTVGRQYQTPLHQRVIVFLLGPVPGIAAGTALMLSPLAQVEGVRKLAIFMLAINYLNLLPVMPLDGGQIFNLFFARLPLVQALFQAACGVALLAAGAAMGNDGFLRILGIMILVGAVARLKYRGLVNALARRFPKGGAPLGEEGMTRTVFEVLRESPYREKPFREKFQAATHLLHNVPLAAPSLRLVLGATAAYVAVFAIPVALVAGRMILAAGGHAAGDFPLGLGGADGAAAGRILEMKPDPSIRLTEAEVGLVAAVGFEQEVLVRLKQLAGGAIERLAAGDDEPGPLPVAGLSIAVPPGMGGILVGKLREELAARGYLPFVDQMNFGNGDDRVGLIRSADSFDVLRLKKTDGINYGHTSEEVLARLQEWNSRFPLTIVGAGRDWVDVELREAPADPKAFAEEVRRFCPDTVDQGFESVEALAGEIAESKHLFLWWD